MNHWAYFYERSIGCGGVLKDWLVRTVASTLQARAQTLTLAQLQAQGLSNAQCESMAMDAQAAEQKLQYTESRREHLWSLLGMSTMSWRMRRTTAPERGAIAAGSLLSDHAGGAPAARNPHGRQS